MGHDSKNKQVGKKQVDASQLITISRKYLSIQMKVEIEFFFQSLKPENWDAASGAAVSTE